MGRAWKIAERCRHEAHGASTGARQGGSAAMVPTQRLERGAATLCARYHASAPRRSFPRSACAVATVLQFPWPAACSRGAAAGRNAAQRLLDQKNNSRIHFSTHTKDFSSIFTYLSHFELQKGLPARKLGRRRAWRTDWLHETQYHQGHLRLPRMCNCFGHCPFALATIHRTSCA